MRRKIIGIIIVVFGVLVLSIPLVLTFIINSDSSVVIGNYNNAISNTDENKRKDDLDKAKRYNNELVTGLSSGEDDKYGTYYDLLSYGDDSMIGYISIPKVDINLPIYHGTSDSVLSKGVGHMIGTSLPIGGESTHCVLAGHTGLSYNMFDGLHNLTVGDMFYITVQDKKLAYRVDRIIQALPAETQYTDIVAGKDYVTLVTCMSYGNEKRLLVRGERVL